MADAADPSFETFRTATNAVSFTVISLVAAVALVSSWRSWKKDGDSQNTEFFITARRTQSVFSVCWYVCYACSCADMLTRGGGVGPTLHQY